MGSLEKDQRRKVINSSALIIIDIGFSMYFGIARGFFTVNLKVGGEEDGRDMYSPRST